MTLDIALLAAGRSSRMRGQDKLLEEIEGVPLLRYAALAALGVEGARVLVALPPDDPLRFEAIEGLDVVRIDVPDADQGMGRSIAAVAAVGDGPLVLSLADMPDIGTADYMLLLDVFRKAGESIIVRAITESGAPGHPILFPARLRPMLTTLDGDAGPKALVRKESVIGVPVPGAGTDLDTPEDWVAWRLRR